MPVANKVKVQQRKEWEKDEKSVRPTTTTANPSQQQQQQERTTNNGYQQHHAPSTPPTTTRSSPRRKVRRSPVVTTAHVLSPSKRSPISRTKTSPVRGGGATTTPGDIFLGSSSPRSRGGIGGGNGRVSPPPFGGNSIHSTTAASSSSIRSSSRKPRVPAPSFPKWVDDDDDSDDDSDDDDDDDERLGEETIHSSKNMGHPIGGSSSRRRVRNSPIRSTPPTKKKKKKTVVAGGGTVSSTKSSSPIKHRPYGGSLPSPTRVQRTTISPKPQSTPAALRQTTNKKSPSVSPRPKKKSSNGTPSVTTTNDFTFKKSTNAAASSSPVPKRKKKQQNKITSPIRQQQPLRSAVRMPDSLPFGSSGSSVHNESGGGGGGGGGKNVSSKSPINTKKTKASKSTQKKKNMSNINPSSPKSPKQKKKKKVVVQSPTRSASPKRSVGASAATAASAASSGIPGPPPLESASSHHHRPRVTEKTLPNGKKVIIQQVPVRSQSEANRLRRPSVLREKMKDLKAKGFGKSLKGFVPEVEEKPPKSLIIIWTIMAAELAFDLATTWIAFKAFLNVEDCCGAPIELGPIPLSSTVPFLLLVLAELAFMVRAIQLSMWPSLQHQPSNDVEEEEEDTGDEEQLHGNHDGGSTPTQQQPKKKERRSCWKQCVCAMVCFLKWNARMCMNVVNFATVINPFLSCIVAWMLMYGSDKEEAFTVLALEGVGIILHIISVYLEGDYDGWKKKVWHFVIPWIPLVITVALCLAYLRQGGVCYLVEQRVFLFSGCEVCPDTGTPVVDGKCGNVTVQGGNIIETLTNAEDVTDLIDRSFQDKFCANGGNPENADATPNFCWFPYTDEE